MSDEKVESGKGADADAGAAPADKAVRGSAAEGNTADRKPDVDGGQPPVGADRATRNTEF